MRSDDSEVRASNITRALAIGSFSTERVSDGERILLRGRRLERGHYLGSDFPVVVTLEHSYSQERDDGLPTKEHHALYGQVLFPLVDAIERASIGIHVLGDTHQGLVRDWFYVKEVREFASLAQEHLHGKLDFEIYHDEDPSWDFLDAAIEPIRESSWK